MSTLPSFTINQTMHINSIIEGDPLSGAALANASVVFTSNIPFTTLISYQGNLYPSPAPVTVPVGPDGTLSINGQPVALLANDAGLSVSQIQWTAVVYAAIPGGSTLAMTGLTFTAPATGEVKDLSSVVATAALPAIPQFLVANLSDSGAAGRQIVQAATTADVVNLLGITGGSGVVQEVWPGASIEVDSTDPANPVVSLNPSVEQDISAAATAASTAQTAADTAQGTANAAASTAASKLAAVVGDTTPKLGGDLDAQGHTITTLNDPSADSHAATAGWTNAQIAAATAALVASAPGTLDTLNELATALGNDPNFATTISTSLGGKQPITAALTALAALTPAANTLPYFSTSSGAALATLTAFAQTLLAATDATAALAALGAIPNASLSNSSITIAGTSVALGTSITLDTLTALSTTGLVKRTGPNAFAVATPGTDYPTVGSVTAAASAASAAQSTANAAVPTSGALGTPSSGTLTNCKGTAYDLSLMQTTGTRAVGLGANEMGVQLQRNVTFTSVTYRCGSADASGSMTVQLYLNGSALSGTSATIAYGDQITGTTVTGSWSISAGQVLTVDVSAVGTTPGIGLVADIMGHTV